MKAKLCFPEKKSQNKQQANRKNMHHRQKAENRSGFRKKRKKEPTRLIMFRFLKKKILKREKKKQEEEEEEEGRPVSDGPKSNQRPGSACSQTQTYAAQGRKQRLIHTCSLNNTLGKKESSKFCSTTFFYCCS